MISVGFIGVGGISRSHLQHLKTRGDVQIAALCDVNRDNLRDRTLEFGGKGSKSYQEMLEEVSLDAVWICTPPQVREGPLKACAAKGIPIFCEKPAERSRESADAITAALEALGARVQVGYLFRCLPIRVYS